jgi:hypothetical protein
VGNAEIILSPHQRGGIYCSSTLAHPDVFCPGHSRNEELECVEKLSDCKESSEDGVLITMAKKIELPKIGFSKRIEYLKVSDLQYAEFEALPTIKLKKKWISKTKSSSRFELPNIWESYRELKNER